MIILDTDTISLLDAGTGDAFESLTRRFALHAQERVCVTIISFEEQMRGWLSYISASRTPGRQVEGYWRLHRMLRWYQRQEVLDFDDPASAEFERLRRARIRVGTMDLKIAAIALARGALLLSRNLRDFRKVSGLRVEDWTQPS